MLRRFMFWLLTLGCVFGAFYYFGHLNVSASLLLAVLIGGLLRWQSETKHVAAGADFYPHFVRFTPHVGRMLIDVGIVTEEAWEEAMASTPHPDPWSGDYLCRRGIYAYALFMDAEQSTVVHWPKLAIYTEDLSTNRELDNFKQNDGSLAFPEWYPRFFIKRTRGGYGIGIEVRTSWWEAYGSQTEVGRTKRAESNPLTGITQIFFEVFPYEALWAFTAAQSLSKSTKPAEALTALGWRTSDYGNSPEMTYIQPDSDYTSDYAQVSTNFLRHMH